MTVISFQKPILCIHVGYGKTGSTAIQAWLFRQHDALKSAGIEYPIPNYGVGDSGNGSLLLEALVQPYQRPWWLKAAQESGLSVLFSREQLARELSEPGRCEQLALWAQRWGFASVQMLLFVRDPREHCYSLWAQKVKRSGECRSLDVFSAEYDSIHVATNFYQRAIADKLEVDVLDFDKHRSFLDTCFLKWLSRKNLIGEDQMSIICSGDPLEKFNVTPTQSQIILKRFMNKFWLSDKVPLPSKYIGIFYAIFSRNCGNYSQNVLASWERQVDKFNTLLGENNSSSDYIEKYPFA